MARADPDHAPAVSVAGKTYLRSLVNPLASCLVKDVTLCHPFLWKQSVPIRDGHVITRQSDATPALQSDGPAQFPSGENWPSPMQL